MTPGRPLRTQSASLVMPSSANRFRHPGTTPTATSRRAANGEEHRGTATSPNDIARDLTIWLPGTIPADQQEDQTRTFETRPRR